MALLQSKYFVQVERGSIDEFFMDVTDIVVQNIKKTEHCKFFFLRFDLLFVLMDQFLRMKN